MKRTIDEASIGDSEATGAPVARVPPRTENASTPATATRLSSATSMPDSFFSKLGDSETPDEAADIEHLVAGHTEYSDLPEERKQALRAIITRIVKSGSPKADPAQLEAAYRRWSHLKSGGIARKSELMGAYRELVRGGSVQPCDALESILIKKKGKSHSGVLVITVLMGPSKFSCPKDCHYCPNQPGIARSYLLKEPGVLRGFRNHWDPVLQFVDRASALENNGHPVDKIEILILGGTFSFYPKDYAEDFIGALFYAANTYFDAAPHRARKSIEEEIAMNEHTRCRIIGVTAETRPDYITMTELRRFRKLGITRVQIGIQHLDDDVLEVVNRECPTSKTIVAIQRLLDSGFKVDAHWMPDLPGSSFEKDMDMFRFLLSAENRAFQVDQWKVYPTMTVPYTKIKEWYDQGLYKPYAENDNGDYMVKLLLYILEHAPHRLRLNRIVRDIPNSYILGGENRVNLRQVLDVEMKRRGIVCKDIRERECKGVAINAEQSAVFIDEFTASHGTEFYISVENADRTVLFGHLRLRLRDDFRDCLFPCLQGAALIRELHTYGKLVAVSTSNDGSSTQHVGVGAQLLALAEDIARQRGFAKMAVISGVGVRGYYAKHGYSLQETYMIKQLVSESLWARLRRTFAS